MINRIKIADVVIEINVQTEQILKFCKNYITSEPLQLSVAVTPEDVERERLFLPEIPQRLVLSDSELESLALYRKLCSQLLAYHTFLFHSSAISVDGRAYLFAAPSGTGKSTHTSYWRAVFGERAVMINDDKPLIRCCDDGIYVYGTPWSGKHNLSTNTRAPIAGICILERGKSNHIQKVSMSEAYPMLLNQTYRPKEADQMAVTLRLLNCVAEKIPLYGMQCTMSEEAARMAYDVMSNNQN